MAWNDITTSDEYKQLSPRGRSRLKQRFFEESILPDLASISDEGKQKAFNRFMETPDDTGEGVFRSATSAFARGALRPLSDIPIAVGALTGSEGIEDFGKDIQGGIESAFPVNPAQEGFFTTEIPGVAGQVTSMIGTGLGAGAAARALAGTTAAAKLGAKAAVGTQAFTGGASGGAQRADELGLTPEEKRLRSFAGGATELVVEALPFGMLTETGAIRKLLGETGEKAAKESIESGWMSFVPRPVKEGIKTESIEEGFTEGIGQATDIAFAPEQANMDLKQIGKAMLLGGVGGAMFGGVNAAIAPKTAEAFKYDGEFVRVRDFDELPADVKEEYQRGDTRRLVPDRNGKLIGYKPAAETIEADMPTEIVLPDDIAPEIVPEVTQMVEGLTQNPTVPQVSKALAEDFGSGAPPMAPQPNLLTGAPRAASPSTQTSPIDSIQQAKSTLDQKAQALGFGNIRAFNAQNQAKQSLTAEQQALLDEYANLQSQIRGLKYTEAANLSDEDFSAWQKTRFNPDISNENDLVGMSQLLMALQQRGDTQNANRVRESILQKRRKTDWTIQSWADRFGNEDLPSQDEIDATNADAQSWNEQIDGFLEIAVSQGQPTSAPADQFIQAYSGDALPQPDMQANLLTGAPTNGDPIARMVNASKSQSVYGEDGEIDRNATREKLKSDADAMGITVEELHARQAAEVNASKQAFWDSLNDGDVITWETPDGKIKTATVEVSKRGTKYVVGDGGYEYQPMTNEFLMNSGTLKVTPASTETTTPTQTITGSNVQTGTEMPVLDESLETSLGVEPLTDETTAATDDMAAVAEAAEEAPALAGGETEVSGVSEEAAEVADDNVENVVADEAAAGMVEPMREETFTLEDLTEVKPRPVPRRGFIGEVRDADGQHVGDLWVDSNGSYRVFRIEYGKILAESESIPKNRIKKTGSMRLSAGSSVDFYKVSKGPSERDFRTELQSAPSPKPVAEPEMAGQSSEESVKVRFPEEKQTQKEIKENDQGRSIRDTRVNIQPEPENRSDIQSVGYSEASAEVGVSGERSSSPPSVSNVGAIPFREYSDASPESPRGYSERRRTVSESKIDSAKRTAAIYDANTYIVMDQETPARAAGEPRVSRSRDGFVMAIVSPDGSVDVQDEAFRPKPQVSATADVPTESLPATGQPTLGSVGAGGGQTVSQTGQNVSFGVDEQLLMRSPFTNEDSDVSFRGVMPDGKAVVWTGKTQMAVPLEWLRRAGEPLPVSEVKAGSADISAIAQESQPESSVTAPTDRQQPLPLPKTKDGLIAELIGPIKDDYVARQAQQKTINSYKKFSKDELLEMVKDQRIQDAKFKRRQEVTSEIIQKIKEPVNDAGAGWVKSIKEIAKANGIEDYSILQGNSRGEEIYRIAARIADRGDTFVNPFAESNATPAPQAQPPAATTATQETESEAAAPTTVTATEESTAAQPAAVERKPLRLEIPQGATSRRTDNVKAQVEGLPDDVIDPFLAHGTDSLDAVEGIVKSGPSQDAEFYEGRLVPKDDGNPWGNTKTSAGFVIISKPGSSSASPSGVGAVVINQTSRLDEKASAKINDLESRLEGTGVAVLTPEELPNWLREQTAAEPAAVEADVAGVVRFVHTTTTEPGKGQRSGYYPGTYAYESETGLLPPMEGKRFIGELPERDIYTLNRSSDKLKKDAADSGFGFHSGNGNSEVEYLKSLGYKAMRRASSGGMEIIVFDHNDANFVTADEKSLETVTSGENLLQPASQRLRDYIATATGKAKEVWTPERLAIADEFYRTGDRSLLDPLPKTLRTRVYEARNTEESNAAYVAEQKRAFELRNPPPVTESEFLADPNALLDSQTEEQLQQERARRKEAPAPEGESVLRAADGVVLRTGVESIDAEAARNSYNGVIPGVEQTWVGTTADFAEQFPDGYPLGDNKTFPESYHEALVAPDGRAFIFTDQVEILEGDVARAREYGTTPGVEAVKRTLRHESFAHRGFMALPHPLKRRFMDLIESGVIPQAELDYLVTERGYSNLADWRDNISTRQMAAEEWLAHKLERMTELPKTGPVAEFLDWLRDVWDYLTGGAKPNDAVLRDTLRAMHKALGALEPGQRIIDEQVRASNVNLERFPRFNEIAAFDAIERMLNFKRPYQMEVLTKIYNKYKPRGTADALRAYKENWGNGNEEWDQSSRFETPLDASMFDAITHALQTYRVNIERIEEVAGFDIATEQPFRVRPSSELRYSRASRQSDPINNNPSFSSASVPKTTAPRNPNRMLSEIQIGADGIRRVIPKKYLPFSEDGKFGADLKEWAKDLTKVKEASLMDLRRLLMVIRDPARTQAVLGITPQDGSSIIPSILEFAAMRADALGNTSLGNIFRTERSGVGSQAGQNLAAIKAANLDEEFSPNRIGNMIQGIEQDDQKSRVDPDINPKNVIPEVKATLESAGDEASSNVEDGVNDETMISMRILELGVAAEDDPWLRGKLEELVAAIIDYGEAAAEADVRASIADKRVASKAAPADRMAAAAETIKRINREINEHLKKKTKKATPVDGEKSKQPKAAKEPKPIQTAKQIIDSIAKKVTGQQKAKPEPNKVRQLYKQQLKQPKAEAEFLKEALALGVDAVTAKKLFDSINLEIVAVSIGAQMASDIRQRNKELKKAEDELQKTQKKAEAKIKEVSERLSDPSLTQDAKKAQEDEFRRIYNDQVKRGGQEDVFVQAMQDLGVDFETARSLYDIANLDSQSRREIRQAQDDIRRAELSESAASRLIYAQEEELRQGSKDRETNDKGDSINKAFREQLTKPLELDAFISRLAALKVSAKTAERLYKTAERVAFDNAMTEAFAKRIKFLDVDSSALANFVNDLRRRGKLTGEKIKWRDLLSMPVTDQFTIKETLLERIKMHSAMRDLTASEQQALADALETVWQKERRKLFQQMIKRAERKGMTKDAKQRIEDATPKLLEYINQGMLASDAFYAAVGEQYGWQPVPKEDRLKLEKLAAEMQEPGISSMERNMKQEEIVRVLQRNTRLSRAEVLSSFWVLSVLTGGRTHLDMALGILSGALSILKKAVAVATTGKDPKLALKGLSDFGKFMVIAGEQSYSYVMKGESGIILNRRAALNDSFAKDKLSNVLPTGDKLMLLQDKPGDSEWQLTKNKLARGLGKFMGFWERLMAGWDHITASATYHGTMRLASGLNPKLFDAALVPNDADWENAMAMAKLRRPGASRAQTTALAQSLLIDGVRSLGRDIEESRMDQWRNMVAQAMAEGSTASYQETPTGFGGVVYGAVRRITEGTEEGAKWWSEKQKATYLENMGPINAIFKHLGELGYIIAAQAQNILGVRFMRFTGNKLNELISYVPVLGLGRLREEGMMDDGEYTLRGRNVYHNQALGWTALTLYIYMMTRLDEPDEEKKVIVEGSWEDLTPARKSQLMAAGRKPNTVRIKTSDGKELSFNYVSWPFAGWLAGFGSLSDVKRYTPDKWTEKTVADKTMSAAYAGAFAISDISSLSSLSELFGRSTYSTDPTEAFVKRISKAGSNYVGGFVPKFIKDIDSWFDDSAYRPENTWQHLAAQMPLLRRSAGAPVRDIFYEPVNVSRAPWSRAIQMSPDEQEYMMLGRLNSRGIWLTPPNADNRKVKSRTGKTRDMTEEEAVKYMQLTGEGYKQMLQQHGERLLSMDTDAAARLVEKYAARVRERALKKAVARGANVVTVEAL